MAHDVFISHSSKDKVYADAVCATLESYDIRCWVAPRDILPGSDYGSSIVEGLKASKVMILIFSSNSNESVHVKREVERAVNHGVIIVPFKIENVVLSSSMEYFVSSTHWLDAIEPPLENHLKNVAEYVSILINKPLSLKDTVIVEEDEITSSSDTSIVDSQLAEIQYEMAVKMAWADKILQPEEITYLENLAKELNLIEDKKNKIEIKIIGKSIEEIESVNQGNEFHSQGLKNEIINDNKLGNDSFENKYRFCTDCGKKMKRLQNFALGVELRLSHKIVKASQIFQI